MSLGGLRPYAWFRYLPDFGITPVVIARQWASRYGGERDYVAPSATPDVEVEEHGTGTLVRTPNRPNPSLRLLLRQGPRRYRLIRKLITAWYEIGQFYAFTGPRVELYHAARRYLREQRVDAIIATGEPFILFRYASELSRELGMPWVADYRDAWSQNRRRGGHAARRWAEATERRSTASASAVTTVADAVGGVLARVHPHKPVTVVANGYDPEAMAAVRGVGQGREHLTFAFVGTIYGWHPVESVFRAFRGFLERHPDAPVRIPMIGVGNRDSLEELLRSRFRGLAPRVVFTPRLSNPDVAMELAKANVFLMFNNYAYPGTKIFDYLALRRGVLLSYSHDPEAMELKRLHYNIDPVPGTNERVLESMVETTRSGVVVRDEAHLGEVLHGLLREFAEHRTISCDSRDTEQYSRPTQVGFLAEAPRRSAS